MPTTHYELKSELARWSLVSRRSQSDRRLAWVNSTCLLFLLIGLVGARTHPPLPKPVAPVEEAAPVIFEPLPPPPTEAREATEQNEPQKAAAPVVVVVPNSPAVNFSVPTVGTLLAPTAMAQAPPADVLRAGRETREAPRPAPPTFLETGVGDRPAPDKYPPGPLMLQQQGTVTLLMTGDAQGNIETVEVKQSSGTPDLDRDAVNWVRRRWKLPRGQPGHLFEAAIRYVLQ